LTFFQQTIYCRTDSDLPSWAVEFNTSSSAIAEKPHCRVRYRFCQK